jgi:hypothetical protein
MRWFCRLWALVALAVLWTLLFGSAALWLFSVVDSSCYGNGQTDAATTWCEGWLRLYDKPLLFGVVLTWLSGLVILIVVWTAIRRGRRKSQPQS